jgi:hypothetical protein
MNGFQLICALGACFLAGVMCAPAITGLIDLFWSHHLGEE